MVVQKDFQRTVTTEFGDITYKEKHKAIVQLKKQCLQCSSIGGIFIQLIHDRL